MSARSLTEPVRRRIDMAVAVAEERLLSTHVAYALDLIRLVEDDVPFDDALDIYARLLQLSSEAAGVLSTRVLATLGEQTGREPERPDEPEPAREEDGGEKDDDRSFFAQLRDRLRGRMNERLRFMIELEAARTEEALLYAHVENALSFVDLLDGEMPAPRAVDLYMDALEVRDSSSDVIYYLTLSRLADQQLPAPHRAERPIPGPFPTNAAGEAGGPTPGVEVMQSDGADP